MPRRVYDSKQWRDISAQVRAEDGRCMVALPGCTGTPDVADHIVPLEDGGAPYDRANLRAACANCNKTRAAAQKARTGWRRAATRITLIAGPPGAPLTAHAADLAQPGDTIIDYHQLAAATGTPDAARTARASMLRRLRRGELTTAHAIVTTTDPQAATGDTQAWPHHNLVVVDPGPDEAKANTDRHDLVDAWYAARQPERSRDW